MFGKSSRMIIIPVNQGPFIRLLNICTVVLKGGLNTVYVYIQLITIIIIIITIIIIIIELLPYPYLPRS